VELRKYGSFLFFEAFRKLLDVRGKLRELPSKAIVEESSNETERIPAVAAISSNPKEYAQFLAHLIEIMAEGVIRRYG
jgi:hypothetical protein